MKYVISWKGKRFNEDIAVATSDRTIAWLSFKQGKRVDFVLGDKCFILLTGFIDYEPTPYPHNPRNRQG